MYGRQLFRRHRKAPRAWPLEVARPWILLEASPQPRKKAGRVCRCALHLDCFNLIDVVRKASGHVVEFSEKGHQCPCRPNVTSDLVALKLPFPVAARTGSISDACCSRRRVALAEADTALPWAPAPRAGSTGDRSVNKWTHRLTEVGPNWRKTIDVSNPAAVAGSP
jgi:hypothetical protein